MMQTPLMHVMIGAVRKASRVLLRDFGEVEHLRYSIKGVTDFVSATDLRAEEILCRELRAARPEFDILAEERGFVPAEPILPSRRQTPYDDHIKKRWVIDPLDGTRNFIHGFPFFAISIAAQTDDEIIAGAIYAPLADELFTAEKGEGAFLNSQRIRVSSCQTINKGLFAYGRMGSHREKIFSIMRQGAHTRQLGSIALALAYVASARLDGFVTGEAEPWDIAAGDIIVREAGGMVSTLDGAPLRLSDQPVSIAASAATLHPTLVK